MDGKTFCTTKLDVTCGKFKCTLPCINSAEDKKGDGLQRKTRSSFHNFSRKESILEDEIVLRERSFDYKHRYCGHCNTTTDIKEANFFGRSV